MIIYNKLLHFYRVLTRTVTCLLLLILTDATVAQPQQRVWIDTDPACGHSSTSDVDDCLAIMAILASPAFQVVGISSTFGNQPIRITDQTARHLVKQLAAEGMPQVTVYRGARSSKHPWSNAGNALINALEEGPLVFLALGPLTNLSAVLTARPDLTGNITTVIAVMGKRPGHIFRPAEGSTRGINGQALSFTDFNLRKDPKAADTVLDSGVPVTLVPYELSRQVEIKRHDLTQLAASGGVRQWLAERSEKWLHYWLHAIGRDGFYPFDLVAAAYLLQPTDFKCQDMAAAVERDTPWRQLGFGPKSLLVRPPFWHKQKAHHIQYCSSFHNQKNMNLTSLLH